MSKKIGKDNDLLGDDFPTGPIRYTLRNDYMFKAVLQKNKRALTGLLAALLYLPAEEIVDTIIMNPIELGETVDDKTCILDIKIKLNDNKIINIELQVTQYEFWIERSLIYLCRAFDDLARGEDYGKLLPTYHIGILDFWLSRKTKEFYSEYRLLNVKNHELYSDKLGVNVLNLRAVGDDSVSKEPKELYEWAKLFKATTWEEIRMLAESNEYIADTAVTLKQLTADEKIRMQCQAREDYEHDRATLLRQGREEGEKIGEARGIEIGEARGEARGIEIGENRGIEKSIRRLAESYMKQDSALSEDEAMNMAREMLQ